MKESKKITKGHYGYLKYRKKGLLIRAGILLLGILGLYFLGVLTLGTNKNWLTIIAIVSSLPMAMQMATYFAIRKYKDRPEDEYLSVKEIVGNGVLDTGLIVASREGEDVQLDYVYVHETGIYAFTDSLKADIHKQADYVMNFLRLNGVDGEMELFNDLDRYKRRLASLEPSDRDTIDDYYLRQEGVLRAIAM